MEKCKSFAPKESWYRLPARHRVPIFTSQRCYNITHMKVSFLNRGHFPYFHEIKNGEVSLGYLTFDGERKIDRFVNNHYD